jgi:hypothetical protein
LNSDSVAATVVADPDPDALAVVAEAAAELAADDVAAAEPPPALLHPMINAPAALTAMA